MRWDLNNYCRSRSRFLNITEREMSLVFLEVEILSGFVNSTDAEDSSVSSQVIVKFYLITCQVVITDESLTGLVHIECSRKFLSA